MNIITRRTALAAGVAAIGSTVLPNFAMSAIPVADVAPPKLPIENGAALRVLRPTKFLDPDETIFRENVAKFTAQTGVQVRVDFVGWEDLRPQVGVAANTGAGPDVVVAWPDDPHLFSDKLVDLSDIAEYLGKKYGGWYYLAEKYGKKWGTNNWIGVPMGGTGGPIVYRKSWVKAAGFDTVPTDLPNFLKLCQNLNKNGHPAGFALGNSVGDANGYANWLLWSHGGYLVDENNKVAINSKAAIEALNYARELYPTLISGVLSWQDPSNNKAFINGDIAMTQNGVSIYYALKTDPKTRRAGRRYGPRADAIGGFGDAAGIGADAQHHGVQAYEISECGQGMDPLHDGAGAVREMADGLHRLLVAAAEGLCAGGCVEIRSEDRGVPGDLRHAVLERVQGADQCGIRGGDGGLCECADVRGREQRAGDGRGCGEGSGAAGEAFLSVVFRKGSVFFF